MSSKNIRVFTTSKMFKRIITFALATFAFYNCDNCVDHPAVSGDAIVIGTIKVNPDTARRGDIVYISTTTYISITSLVNAKNDTTTIIKDVDYFIDNKPVAKSADKNAQYQAKFTIPNNLSVGGHKVSVRINSKHKKVKIAQAIAADSLYIKE